MAWYRASVALKHRALGGEIAAGEVVNLPPDVAEKHVQAGRLEAIEPEGLSHATGLQIAALHGVIRSPIVRG